LFDENLYRERLERLYHSADQVAQKYGKHTLFLGTSFLAKKFGAHLGERGDMPRRQRELLPGETTRRRLNLPMLFVEV